MGLFDISNFLYAACHVRIVGLHTADKRKSSLCLYTAVFIWAQNRRKKTTTTICSMNKRTKIFRLYGVKVHICGPH